MQDNSAKRSYGRLGAHDCQLQPSGLAAGPDTKSEPVSFVCMSTWRSSTHDSYSCHAHVIRSRSSEMLGSRCRSGILGSPPDVSGLADPAGLACSRRPPLVGGFSALPNMYLLPGGKSADA